MPDDDLAMQSRCVHCLREQWAVVVSPVSRGEAPCAWCGKKSAPMTIAEYWAALARRREANRGPQ